MPTVASVGPPSAWSEHGLRRWRNLLACLGLGAIAAFVVALAILHGAAGRDAPGHMSEFANSPYSLLWAMAVYTFILGGAMVVWALRPALHDCPAKWIGIAMLWLAGAGAVLLATFPADDTYVRTLSGRVHNEAAVATFVLLGVAMVVLAPAFRASPGLGGFARTSVLLGVLVTGAWMTYLVTALRQIDLYAPAQRVLVGLITVWFVLLGLRLRDAHAPRPRRNLRTVVIEPGAPESAASPRPVVAGTARRRASRPRAQATSRGRTRAAKGMRAQP